MKKSIATVSLGGSLTDKLDAIAAVHFDGVEIFWSPLRERSADRIFFVQLGDAPRMNLDALTLRRNHSRMPGEGDFDVAGFLRAVLATGYSGTVSLEIFNEKTPESPLASAHAAMHSMLLVEERARGANERESSKPVGVGASKP
jgi:4-hydroxyphenylpyruvate dioxygenase